MKLKDDVELKEIKAMVGKKAYFRTATGPSLPHVIDSIEFTKEGIIFVLKREHVALVKRRKLAQVELIKESKESKKVVDIGPTAKKVVDESPVAKKIDPNEVAKALGAEPWTPKYDGLDGHNA
jgi:hypothetical protein